MTKKYQATSRETTSSHERAEKVEKAEGERKSLFLLPRRLCETRAGDLAFILGRLRFRRGGPMLVEHLNGVLLEHTLCGRVLTCGYGEEFDITHVFFADDI